MSSRFKIRNGETEIEFEGPTNEVSSKYKEAFDWLKTLPIKVAPSGQTEDNVTSDLSLGKLKKQGKPDGRGGARSAVVGPAVDTLITEGFFNTFKSNEQVLEELKRKNVPVGDLHIINTAVNRRVPKSLDRIKNDQGKWVYRKKNSS